MHHSRPRTTTALGGLKTVLSRYPILPPPGVEYLFNYEFHADQSSPHLCSAVENILSSAEFHGEPRETLQEIA